MLGSHPRPSSREPREIIGNGPAIQVLRRELVRYARLDGPVLIQGETGTGKELCAKAIHALSPWSKGPLVAVNCGALPQELVEAELFGSTAGAFTGARNRQGLLASAEGGTLFLDEIGDLPLVAQAVLLRALENGEVRPVGSEKTRGVKVRLVAATHHPLPERVRDGLFRADLLHRLAGLVIQLPPLRERLEDLPLLVAALAPDLTLSDGAWEALRRHRWPGNVRELKQALTRARALSDGGLVNAEHLRLEWLSPVAQAFKECQSLEQELARCVHRVVREHRGNVRAAARALSISPTTIYRYLTLPEENEGESQC